MKFNEGAQLDPSQVSGGGGSGGKIALGGGAGVVVVILALIFGINPGDILGSGSTGSSPGNPTAFAQCTRGSDIDKDRNCRFVAYTNSIQKFWGTQLKDYQVIQVDSFTGQVSTACGTASSAVGPFYCPGDTTVYLDLGFFDQMLKGELGAKGGDAAEAYVLAHEFGHHIQKQLGTMAKVQGAGTGTGPSSAGVRLELQADCYAGVWFKHATDDPSSPISEVTSDDLKDALDAAASVGDDRIQQKTQGQVTEESWTHGSAANRQKWLTRGFSSGNPNDCNTFAGDGP